MSKYNRLKKEVIEKLQLFIKYIENDELEKAESMLDYSPAGDDMGCDNDFIYFDGKDEYGNTKDLGDMVDEMKACKK